MNMYEFNKSAYGNLPAMTDAELIKSIPYVVSFLDKTKVKYYLMIDAPYEQGNTRYYTMFAFPNGNYNPGAMAREIIDLAKDLGPVKSIEESSSHMLEIWIGNGDQCKMYSVMDWADGVIEVV